MGFLDKFKKTNKILEPDKFAKKEAYIEISIREFFDLDLKELEKKIGKNITNHIKKAQKMDLKDLKTMYDNVLDTKHNFVENANTWSRFSINAEKMDIADHWYKRLRDELQKEIKKRNS